MPDFVLEIGFEEMPASWLPALQEQARQRFQDLAARDYLVPEEVAAFAGPRRIVLRGRLREQQADREETIWGPSLKVARDAAGVWMGAAQGFARKMGVRPEDLQQGLKDPAASELHLFHLKKTPGRPAHEVLPGTMAALLRALAFPKRMSWDAWLEDGKGSFPFGRPIRWLVALLGGEVVPFTIHAHGDGGRGPVLVEAGRHTYGHRFLPRGAAGRPLPVDAFADLEARLGEHFVIVDPGKREARIREGLASFGAGEMDHELIGEWRDLVEHPTVVAGRIPAEFQTLPVEVLETVLVHHQKYIPLRSEGQVTRFAALTNTDGAAAPEIVRGMERVVVARLRDARFFFAEDMKRPLEDRVEDLQGILFHKGLGTYKDKSDRLVSLVDRMATQGLLTPDERRSAREAARLAKADLTSLMVREFPELQGVMGAVYLRAQGNSRDDVISAVRWHYHPVSIEIDAQPAKALAGGDSTVFGAVSLADKIDTLAGYFALGLVPSGSSDPYGLRRAAQGAIRILLDFWTADEKEPRPSLRDQAAGALRGYRAILKRPEEEVQKDLESFLLDRLRYVLVSRGFAPDEVEAVLAAREPDALDDPYEAGRRVQALHRVRLEAAEDFEHLAVAFKRAKNILGEAPPDRVDAGLLSEAAERELHEAVGKLREVNGGYEARLRSLSGLRRPVDHFFEDVLVMAEDPQVRANRLGLLAQALSLFYRIADISKLGG